MKLKIIGLIIDLILTIMGLGLLIYGWVTLGNTIQDDRVFTALSCVFLALIIFITRHPTGGKR